MDKDQHREVTPEGGEVVEEVVQDPQVGDDGHDHENLDNFQHGDLDANMQHEVGAQPGGPESSSASLVHLNVNMQVPQGPSSDSTVSNPDLTAFLDMGSETWYAKKTELTQKFQCAKEREKALKAQLSAQRERIKLEIQERENHRLELELSHREFERSAQEHEQQRLDDLTTEKLKLEEAAKIREHEC